MTPSPYHGHRHRRAREAGTALVFGLIVLLILTIIGVSALRTSSLEQLMAGGVPQRITLQDGDVVYVPVAAFVYVIGEIQRPGRYRLEKDTTIQKAVTIAGGFTKYAATKSMTVQRMVDGKRLDFQASPNDLLQAEDVVVVRPSLF